MQKVAESVRDRVRLTLDPSERHGFEYQSWFGFTLYAEGARGALGRGGTYTIAGSDEAATGFSIYADPLLEATGDTGAADANTVFLDTGYDRDVARQMREQGWRTIEAVTGTEQPAALGCTHRLRNGTPQRLS